MSAFQKKIYFFLIFGISFGLSFYLLDFSKKETGDQKLLTHSGEAKKYTNTINGQKVSIETIYIEQAAESVFEKIKAEIENSPSQKLINTSASANRFFLSYTDKNDVISVVITPISANSCEYTMHRGLKASAKEQVLAADLPAMNDAKPLLNMKGEGNRIVYSYSTRYTEKEIFEFYRKAMAEKGYREESMDTPEAYQIEGVESNNLLFVKDRKNITISVMADPSGGGNMVYIIGI